MRIRRPSKVVSLLFVAGIATSLTTAISPTAGASNNSPPFKQCPAVGADSSCEILIVINSDRTVSVLSDPSLGPYDGGDDTLVGVQNNSSSSVPALTVIGPNSGLSRFDGDGLCSYGVPGCPFGPTGYEGPGTSFVTDPSLPDSAEVDFASGGLSPNGHTYFSLEGALTSALLRARQGNLGTVLGLGDSIAAGYGLGNAEGDPNQLGDNASAYPALVAEQLGDRLYNYASSGACTFPWPQCPTKYTSVYEQIQDAYNAGIHPNIVTLTVGGDDLDFSYCLPAYFESVLGIGPSPCSSSQIQGFINQDFASGFSQDLALISKDFPGARVLVTQQYNPFPPQVTSYGQTCGLYTALVGGATVEAILNANIVDKISLFNTFLGSIVLNQFQQEVVAAQNAVNRTLGGYLNQVNAIIGRDAAAYGDRLVPLNNFVGHDMCAAARNASQWVFGLHIHIIATPTFGSGIDFTYPGPICPSPDSFVDPNQSLTNGPQVQAIDDIGVVGIEADDNCMLHPTVTGQQQIANAVLASLPSSFLGN